MIQNQEKLYKEIDNLKQISFEEDELVLLDVGGTHQYTVKRSLLCLVPNSKLSIFFQNDIVIKKKINDRIFLDRNGKVFGFVLDYLRSNREIKMVFEDKNKENLY